MKRGREQNRKMCKGTIKTTCRSGKKDESVKWSHETDTVHKIERESLEYSKDRKLGARSQQGVF